LGKNLIFVAAEAVSTDGISGGRIYGIKSRKMGTKPLVFHTFRGQAASSIPWEMTRKVEELNLKPRKQRIALQGDGHESVKNEKETNAIKSTTGSTD